MLSSWIWLCALSKAVMAIRQPEDDQALQQDPFGTPLGARDLPGVLWHVFLVGKQQLYSGKTWWSKTFLCDKMGQRNCCLVGNTCMSPPNCDVLEISGVGNLGGSGVLWPSIDTKLSPREAHLGWWEGPAHSQCPAGAAGVLQAVQVDGEAPGGGQLGQSLWGGGTRTP